MASLHKGVNSAMDEKQFASLTKQLGELISPLKAIARVELMRELYPQTEREKLIAEYSALELADREAFETVQRAHAQLTPPGLSYEERVQQLGKSETDRQLVPVMEATEHRRNTSATHDAFRKKHRLIARLFDSTQDLGKTTFED